jgi:hypothetical protein
VEADSGSWEEGGLGVSWVRAREGEVQDTGYRAGRAGCELWRRTVAEDCQGIGGRLGVSGWEAAAQVTRREVLRLCCWGFEALSKRIHSCCDGGLRLSWGLRKRIRVWRIGSGLGN